MVVSVIQQGKGVLHFSGELDGYNLQLLGEHASMLQRDTKENEIRIALDANERAALTPEGKDLLERLAAAGYAISMFPRS